MKPILPIPRHEALMREIRKIPGLIRYYPMNEPTGDVMINCAPATNGLHNGTINGVTIAQPGRVGRSYLLDGVNDFISVGTDTFKQLFGYTVLCIVGVADDAKEKNIINETSGAGYARCSFFLNSTENLGWFGRAQDSDAGSLVTSTTSLTLGTVNLVGVTVDISSKTVRLYTNGQLLASSGAVNFTGTSIQESNSTSGLIVSPAPNSFNSSMQHLSIYSRPLNQNEITRLSQIAGLSS